MATRNPIPSEAPEDLVFNAGKIDEEVNSDAEYYVDRFDKHRLTNEGRNKLSERQRNEWDTRFQSIAAQYGLREVPYVAGNVLELRTDYVEIPGEGGYSLNYDVPLPYTLTGDWATESVNFTRMSDATLRGDLSSQSGAGLIGTQDGRSVQEAISDLSIISGENEEKIDGLIGRLPASSSDFASLSEALNSGESVITIPNGHYVFNEKITVNSPDLTLIKGEGDVTLDFSGADGGLVIDGGLDEITTGIDPLVAGSNFVKFSTDPGVNKGDVLIFWNPEPFSLNLYRTYYRDGFMAEVAKVESSGKVILYGTVPSCNFSSMQVFKMSTNKPFSIEGVKIIPPAGGHALTINCRNGVSIDSSLTIEDDGYAGLEVNRCFNVLINTTSAYANQGDAYPIIIANSQNYRIIGTNSNSTRHSIGLGGGAAQGSVPTRNGLIVGCYLGNDGTTGTGAADAHGNVVGIKYVGCIMNSAANIAGRNAEIIDCTIFARSNPRDGSATLGSEVNGGYFIFKNITIVADNATLGASFGVIDLTCRYAREDLLIKVDGLTIQGDGFQYVGQAPLINLSLYSQSFDKAFHIDVAGVKALGSVSSNSLVRVRVPTDTPQFATIEPSSITIEEPFPNKFTTLLHETAGYPPASVSYGVFEAKNMRA